MDRDKDLAAFNSFWEVTNEHLAKLALGPLNYGDAVYIWTKAKDDARELKRRKLGWTD